MNKSVTKLAFLAAAAAVLTTAMSGAVHAQTGPASPQPVAAMPEIQHEPERVSPGAALGLSVLGTLVGYGSLAGAVASRKRSLYVVGVLGILVGPSAGHFYTRESRRAWNATGVRGLGLLTMALGGVISVGACTEDPSCESSGPTIFWGGAILTVGATIYSIIDSRFSAHRVNRVNRSNLTIAPAPMVGPDRSTGMGMTLSGSF